MEKTLSKPQLRKAIEKQGYYWYLAFSFGVVALKQRFDDDSFDNSRLNSGNAFLNRRSANVALKQIKSLLKQAKKA